MLNNVHGKGGNDRRRRGRTMSGISFRITNFFSSSSSAINHTTENDDFGSMYANVANKEDEEILRLTVGTPEQEAHTSSDLTGVSSSFPPQSDSTTICTGNRLKALLIVLFNIITSLAANIGYLTVVNSTHISAVDKTAMQILMAGFKLFWNAFVVRAMLSFVQEDYEEDDLAVDNVRLQLLLMVFNSVVAPCLVSYSIHRYIML